ncbi:hypothetical protein Tco_0736671 [Tanacetum coccineum]
MKNRDILTTINLESSTLSSSQEDSPCNHSPQVNFVMKCVSSSYPDGDGYSEKGQKRSKNRQNQARDWKRA